MTACAHRAHGELHELGHVLEAQPLQPLHPLRMQDHHLLVRQVRAGVIVDLEALQKGRTSGARMVSGWLVREAWRAVRTRAGAEGENV
eukprot:7245481-Pyramimonas_sp.AAC.1